MKNIIAILIFWIPLAYCSLGVWYNLQEKQFDATWQIAEKLSAFTVNIDGCALTNITETPSPPGTWYPAEVPGTILTNKLRNKVIPDPYYSNGSLYIKDAFNVPADYYTYWYYARFNLPGVLKGNCNRYHLQIRGINYRADVFLNGQRVNKDTLVGMFKVFELEITDELTDSNVMAFLVHPPDPVGNATAGQGGDGRIGKSVTAQYMAGWDWAIPTADRSTGIWDIISIKQTCDVKLSAPYVQSFVSGVRYPQNDGTQQQPPVVVKVGVDLENLSCFKSYAANVTWYWKYLGNNSGDSNFNLGQSVTITVDPLSVVTLTFDNFTITNPRLWWPNGLGEQNLYLFKLAVEIPGASNGKYYSANAAISDEVIFRTGLRSIFSGIFNLTKSTNHTDYISSFADEYILPKCFNFYNQTSTPRIYPNFGRYFTVNGQRIFIKGANWIGVDSMMRLQYSRKLQNTTSMEFKYRNQLKMIKMMNFNLIRVWGGGITERPEFYDAADEYGLLIWQEFWITGDCNGRWYDATKKDSQQRRRAYPDDHSLFLESAKTVILLLRNHPSLALWCGGNEIAPPEDLLIGLKRLISSLDQQRLFLPYSLSSGIGPRDGPYNIQIPNWFYYARDFAFNPELGSVGMVVEETMKEILPASALGPPYDTVTLNNRSLWVLHKYIPYSNPNGGYNTSGTINVPDQIYSYGIPSSLYQYTTYAQIVNYVQYFSLFSSRSIKMWKWYTGVNLWKVQSPWLGLRGNMYDYYLDVTGGYGGLRHANTPLSVQMDIETGSIFLVNNHFTSYNVSIQVTRYEIAQNGTGVNGSSSISCGGLGDSASATELCKFNLTSSSDGIFFLAITLKSLSDFQDLIVWSLPDTTRKLIQSHEESVSPLEKNIFLAGCENTYWLSRNPASPTQFVPLQNLSQPQLNFTVQTVIKQGSFVLLYAVLSNLSPSYIGFSIRAQVLDINGGRILPVYYSDNFFTVLPNKELTIRMEFETNEPSVMVKFSSPNIGILKFVAQL